MVGSQSAHGEGRERFAEVGRQSYKWRPGSAGLRWFAQPRTKWSFAWRVSGIAVEQHGGLVSGV